MAPLFAENHGFLPTRGSFMLDFVFVAMFGIVLVLAASIYLVRYRQRYELHKRIQLIMAAVLLVAVTAFEVDVQFFSPDWKEWTKASRFSSWVFPSLYIHLCFAIPTPVLWVVVIVRALRRFAKPARPNEHSRSHIVWARIAAFGMLMTALTGWIFYIVAFVM